MKNIIPLILLFIPFTGLQSQTIRGRVVDSFTYEKLDSVTVSYVDKNDSVVLTSNMSGWSRWSFYDNLPKTGKYKLVIKTKGYEDKVIDNVSVRVMKGRMYVRDLGQIPVNKERTIMLDEVVAKATLVKMVVKGDTMVYNAAAFNLSHGSMLDNLVKMLPGVELLNGGEIYVNGRKVSSLLLNGEDFFKGNPRIALENLPAYMVDKIKVYEKQSDRDIAFGVKKEEHISYPLVMDVNLKREYRIGWIANAEGGYGTDDHYMGRAFGLRFSDHSRLTLYANINDLNDNSYSNSQGMWQGGIGSGGETNTKAGGLDLLINDRRKRYKLNSTLTVGHTKMKNEEYQSDISFLENGNVFGRSTSHTTDYSLKIRSENKLDLTNNNNWFLTVKPNVSYDRYDNSGRTMDADFSEELYENYFGESLDSLFIYGGGGQYRNILISGVRSSFWNKGHDFKADVDFDGEWKFPSFDRLRIFGDASYGSGSADGLRRTDILNGTDSSLDEFQRRFSHNSSSDYNYHFGGSYDYSVSLGKSGNGGSNSISLSPQYEYSQIYNSASRPYYILDEADEFGTWSIDKLSSSRSMIQEFMNAENSYYSSKWQMEHKGKLAINFNHYHEGKKMTNDYKDILQINFDANVQLRHKRDKLDYSRDETDTLACRNRFFVEPDARLEFKVQRGPVEAGYALNYRYYSSSPDLLYSIDYRDSSSPLMVREGNPLLSDSHTHVVKFDFWHHFYKSRRNRYINADIQYMRINDRLCQSMTYNKITGVRTYRPETVNGNWNIVANLKFNRPSAENKMFGIRNNFRVAYLNDVDMISLSSEENSLRNTVRQTTIGDEFKLDYQINGLLCGLKANFSYNHSESERFETMNTFNYSYGLSGSYTVSPWDMDLSTDISMRSRRGYQDNCFNTDELVWNMSLSKSIMNGNLTFKLKAYDILNQISSVRYAINAQMQTESWHNMLGRYVMLSVMYRLNLEPKKKR